MCSVFTQTLIQELYGESKCSQVMRPELHTDREKPSLPYFKGGYGMKAQTRSTKIENISNFETNFFVHPYMRASNVTTTHHMWS